MEFEITYANFSNGFSNHAAFNNLTEVGLQGQASKMQNVDVTAGDYMTQGPGLADLTNGNQAGAVTELIVHILDKAIAANTTYGIGGTKLFQITNTAVTSNATWPHTITGSAGTTAGASVVDFKGNLYYFYNKASGGDIGKYDLSATFTDNWGSTVPTGAAALQADLHPAVVKEDLIVFGNGRYVGTYTGATNTLAPTKLDFGSNTQVADVCFNANQWYIAVNSGVSGTNKNTGHIAIWEGSATSATLDDETSIGPYKIGFLYPIGGIIFVAFQDLTMTAGYKIGYISGRKIKTLGYFSGSLPTFQQKTLYKNTILFAAGGLLYSHGAMTDDLHMQTSQIAQGGYTSATVGAVAAPFGTPYVAATDGGANFRLAQFSGYDTNCTWKSLLTKTIKGRMKGYIDKIIVVTSTLVGTARADITIEADQASVTGSSQSITGAGKRRFVFTNPGTSVNKALEDFRVALSWANGSTVNPCQIREVQVFGHFAER